MAKLEQFVLVYKQLLKPRLKEFCLQPKYKIIQLPIKNANNQFSARVVRGIFDTKYWFVNPDKTVQSWYIWHNWW